MKKIITLFALMIAITTFAQNDEAFVDTMVAQKMAELEMQDNPEYFFRKSYCEGNIQMFILPSGKMCTSKSTYYTTFIFWKDAMDNMMIQKFDNCGSFTPITITINKIVSKSLKDKQALKTGEVKPYKGEEVDDNAFGNMSVKSCHKEYKFVFGNKTFDKSFKEFDLTNDSKYKNLNLKHNQSLQLITLDNELSKILQDFEEAGRFIREN